MFGSNGTSDRLSNTPIPINLTSARPNFNNISIKYQSTVQKHAYSFIRFDGTYIYLQNPHGATNFAGQAPVVAADGTLVNNYETGVLVLSLQQLRDEFLTVSR